jgi:calcineurin-like phosphoesterase family protein
MKTFFTSDQHFGHANIINLCNRPFDNPQEMDREMIRRWNEVVTPDDDVYYLGDLTLHGEAVAHHYLDKLHYRKMFTIEGNHDHRWYNKVDAGYFRIHKLPPIHEMNMQGKHIVLCHYPMREWNKYYRGAYHLFGHSHNTQSPYGYSFDVGVDCWNFYPVSFEQVVDKMNGMDAPYTTYTEDLSL